jgi:hypothetical protein
MTQYDYYMGLLQQVALGLSVLLGLSAIGFSAYLAYYWILWTRK